MVCVDKRNTLLPCLCLTWVGGVELLHLKGDHVPSEHGSIPGSSERPFFIQVLNYIQKSGAGTSQPCPHETALQKAEAGNPTVCGLCSVHMCVPLQQSCQLSCFCLQQHSLLLRSSVCSLGICQIFCVIWACSSPSTSKTQFCVEDLTTQPAKQQVNFRTGTGSFWNVAIPKSRCVIILLPCIVVVSTLTIKLKSSVIFQRSFHSIPPIAARDKCSTWKTYERGESLVTMTIISVFETQ